MKYISPPDGHELDRAIGFLVKNYSQTGKNPKPVVSHSIRLAIYLLDYGYNLDLVITAVLHDLIEDSDTTKEDILLSFGTKIANWVDALSFKTSIEDKEARYKEMFDRIKLAGREALIIKCADIYSNSLYIRLVDDMEKQSFLVSKLKYFLDFSKELIQEEVVWRELAEQEIIESNRIAVLKV